MKISIVTLFPELFAGVFDHSILKRAQEKDKLTVEFINIRDFGIGRHKTVDDKPYGGGVGMVLRVDVLHNAIESARTGIGNETVILMDARGERFTQKHAESLSTIDHLILVCGRYEGFDERILEFTDMQISLGDFILTGGEIPAMAIADSVIRLIPGVIEKGEATQLESFSEINTIRKLEAPQYTRPEIYLGKSVPPVLLSGHEKKIAEFRESESTRVTKKNRPDLL